MVNESRGKQVGREMTPWVVGVAIAIMVAAVVQQSLRYYEIQKEIDAAQGSVNDLRTKNADLTNLLTYVRSPAYTEEQARLKFGFAKPGETLAVIPSSQVPTNAPGDDGSGNVTNPAPQTNQGKWWGYFFPSGN